MPFLVDIEAKIDNSRRRMRWGRIIVGAFLLELLLIIALVPPLQFFGPERVIPFAIPAVLIFGFGVAWWILRKVSHRRVLHGGLIGTFATAIYLLMCLANPSGLRGVVAMYGTVMFIVGNGLRILGCVAGAYTLQVRRPTLS